jgi:uncharacterized membrane protein
LLPFLGVSSLNFGPLATAAFFLALPCPRTDLRLVRCAFSSGGAMLDTLAIAGFALAALPGSMADGAAEAATGPQAGREIIDAALEWVATGIEITGVAIIVIGAAAATVVFLYGGLATVGWPAAFQRYRANLGRGILLGLELLVAADIIGTVAVTPSLQNLTVLALIVVIRTFLSFSLEVEIEGRWPWRRAEAEGAGGRRSQEGATSHARPVAGLDQRGRGSGS